MLFLGWNEPTDYKLTPYDGMRYDSFYRGIDGKEWNEAKRHFSDIQLAEHVIHSFFLNQIDAKLVEGILPEEYARKMVDIVVELRRELISVARYYQLPVPSFLKIFISRQLLGLLGKLEEMARP